MKDLMYYHIMYGGVPMTPAGKARFFTAAVAGGHEAKKVLEYINNLK